MLSKTIVKYIQSLHHKKLRDEHGVFIAEGQKLINDLLASGKFLCKMICATDSWLEENSGLIIPLPSRDIHLITEPDLDKISLLHTPNKVLAVFYKKPAGNIILNNGYSLMLDEIRDPGNLGTIIRISDWFGIENIICSEHCADCYNPKVVQSSMGSLGRVNITYIDLHDFLDNNKGVSVYAATLRGTSLYSLKKINEGIILIGNESKGISGELLKYVKEQITIPRLGNAESLNAAVAAGIILSHLLK